MAPSPGQPAGPNIAPGERPGADGSAAGLPGSAGPGSAGPGTAGPGTAGPGTPGPGTGTQDGVRLRTLVVDDEAHARDELAYLLRQDPRIGPLRTAASAAAALKELEREPVDVLFCDISMPGLDGLDLARVLARFSSRPHLIFVTAHEQHALDAFDLRAIDYVLKPVRPERLAEAVRRVVEAGHPARPEPVDDETIAVELAGVTRFVRRSHVLYVEAQGDYARLHVRNPDSSISSHLLRIPLGVLEERWADVGFVRIHRSTLVALPHVEEFGADSGRVWVRLHGRTLQVSRRHTRAVRDRLVTFGGVR